MERPSWALREETRPREDVSRRCLCACAAARQREETEKERGGGGKGGVKSMSTPGRVVLALRFVLRGAMYYRTRARDFQEGRVARDMMLRRGERGTDADTHARRPQAAGPGTATAAREKDEGGNLALQCGHATLLSWQLGRSNSGVRGELSRVLRLRDVLVALQRSAMCDGCAECVTLLVREVPAQLFHTLTGAGAPRNFGVAVRATLDAAAWRGGVRWNSMVVPLLRQRRRDGYGRRTKAKRRRLETMDWFVEWLVRQVDVSVGTSARERARFWKEGLLAAAGAASIKAFRWVQHFSARVPAKRHPALWVSLMDVAAESGSVRVCQFLASRGAGGHRAIDVAARQGHLDACEFLFSLPEIARSVTADALDSAASGGHMAVLRYLDRVRPPVPASTDALDLAANNGHLAAVEFLHFHRTEAATKKAMTGAAAAGHLDVLRFLHEHRQEGGYTCTQAALDFSARRGHLDTVLYLLDTVCVDYSRANQAIRMAAVQGKLPVVEVLTTRAPHLVPADIMEKICAAPAEHLAVLRYFYARLSLVPNAGCFIAAAGKGHARILEWMCALHEEAVRRQQRQREQQQRNLQHSQHSVRRNARREPEVVVVGLFGEWQGLLRTAADAATNNGHAEVLQVLQTHGLRSPVLDDYEDEDEEEYSSGEEEIRYDPRIHRASNPAGSTEEEVTETRFAIDDNKVGIITYKGGFSAPVAL